MVDGSDVSPNDIAIVGMALRVPGASTLGAFWSNLVGGVESIRDLTQDERAAAQLNGDPVHDKRYVPRTADIPEMEMFDADFFGFSPKEAAIMDPQHRHFLECAWEALEAAGRMPDKEAGPIGVFAASGMGSYFYFNICSNRELVEQTGMFLLRHTGNDKDFLSTRVSYTFDLRGPSVNVQTACSSSLVAVHYAAQSLVNGECDMALAGGVTIEQPHRRGYSFQDGEILSPDGHCRPFDHRAAGTVFGSGVGVVVLRRLADAIADADIVHAVIKGSAINNDGASKAGYLAPSVTGQAEAIIEAQGISGIRADSIGYVECHGTGTYLGDPIEVEALTQAFRLDTARQQFCRIGSVKSNIGHLDTAAGVVSLIKAAMTVKTGQIPPTLGFEKPNPAIDFERSPFVVNDKLTVWPAGSGKRRAGINSLGVGGTNAHVVLEEPPARSVAPTTTGDDIDLLLLSAKSRKALEAGQIRLAEFIAANPGVALPDIAHTLLHGRKVFDHRAAVAVRGREDAVAALSQSRLKRVIGHTQVEDGAGAVFLFPGGGAQHHGMARRLYASDVAFRRNVDEGLGYLPAEAAARLRAAWLEACEPDIRLLLPSVQLPAILIIEVAVARMWLAQGLNPTALLGHSMGENAAACIAGVMSFKDAVNLVRVRGELFETVDKGGMLSVSMGASELRAMLPPELDMASVNAPELCVVSGPSAALDAFAAVLDDKGIQGSRIAIEIAAHSRMLDGILPAFGTFLSTLTLRAPRIPIISNITGTELSAADAVNPHYWVRHLRSTVNFQKSLATLAAGGNHVYIEVGPSRALSSLAKAQGGIDANQVINSLQHPDEEIDDQLYLVSAMGRAWAAGLPINLDTFAGKPGTRRAEVTSYPFQHRKFFFERQQSLATPDTPLQRIASLQDWGYRPTWTRSAVNMMVDAGPTQDWLVFLDDGDTGNKLAGRLRGLGHRVVTVSTGDGFVRRTAQNYVICPEHGRAGYDALAASLAADGAMPTRLLYLPLLMHTAEFRPGSSLFNRTQENGFYGLLHLAQAIADAGSPAELHIVAVTNGAQQVSGEGLANPEKATIEGVAMVLPRELPGVTVRLIDVELERAAPPPGRKRHAGPIATPQAMLDLLEEEALAGPSTEIIALRGNRRWTRMHRHVDLAEASPQQGSLREGGVYLLTGGFGDLALTFARQLSKTIGAHIVLMARTELPPREQWAALARILPRGDRRSRVISTILAIEANGGDVLVTPGDVTNLADVQQAINRAKDRFGAIHGVLHTAGLVDDGPLLTKTSEAADAVFGPKVIGTLVLAEALADEPIDLLVLFSSTSSDIAPAGQVDYVGANAFLNAFAESQASRSDRKTIAVHWGIWSEVGMAARSIESPTGPSREIEAANGPFFERWVEDGDGTRWLEAEVDAGANWLFDEHRLKSGEALMPGTGYVELIGQAIAESGMPRQTILDLQFIAPMFVPEGVRMLVRLRFEYGPRGYKVVVASGANPDALVTNATARLVELATTLADRGADLAAAQARSSRNLAMAAAGESLRSAQEDHLRFGDRWHVLQSMQFGQGEAYARLALPVRFAPDLAAGYHAHPGLLDIATGYAMDLIPGYAQSGALWAPASYGRIVQVRPLPQEVQSWVRLSDNETYGDGFAAFDITIADRYGQSVIEIDQLLLRRVSADFALTSHAVAKANTNPAPRGLRQLAAQIREGIPTQHALDVLVRALASGLSQPIVSSLDLTVLKDRAANVLSEQVKAGQVFERSSDLDSEYVAPATPVEIRLAQFWRELLGIEQIGVNDNFFDIGGHSLVAVRLFRSIRKDFGVDLPISTLFESSTIALLSKLVPANDIVAVADAPALPIDQPVHRVVMHRSSNKSTPLFVCAGMFGNVLNLRQLARQLGTDRDIYGLQAQGLYGDAPPHETFEAAAASCIAEVRAVQPEGPYLLAGFSGGGLVAYEMAHQLLAQGEEVNQIILLDTPLPTQPNLSKADLLSIKLQDLRREGSSFFSNWLANRNAWKEELRRKQKGLSVEASADRFNNDAIEAAFRRALVRYQIKPYPGEVLLMRPRPHVKYRLSNGRRLQEGRTFVLDDNGWSSLVARLKVIEVPGDHDSMVLDPFVRVLADQVRRLLGNADEPRYGRAAE